MMVYLAGWFDSSAPGHINSFLPPAYAPVDFDDKPCALQTTDWQKLVYSLIFVTFSLVRFAVAIYVYETFLCAY